MTLKVAYYFISLTLGVQLVWKDVQLLKDGQGRQLTQNSISHKLYT